MDIDLNSLLVFRHLAQSGSFTETGRRWKISQPAVSLMIVRLESAVGLVLLQRSPIGAQLTADGILFLERANEVCDAYLSFLDGMRNVARRLDREVLVATDQSWFASRILEKTRSLRVKDLAGIQPVYREISGIWDAALESTQYDVVLACRFLKAGLSAGIQEAVIHCERGITVAWNPDFHSFDAEAFSFPEILRTSVLIPDGGVVKNFDSSLRLWCEHAYGMQPANTVAFDSESEAATAAAAGLGVLVAPGDAMPRLGQAGVGLTYVRTFEFLLPEAFTFGVYCRSDESSKDVLTLAVLLGKLGTKLFQQG